MKRLRLALLSRRFWPLAGEIERRVAGLAGALAGEGGQVTVVTAAWNATAPWEYSFQNARVVRLPHAAGRPWGNFRYGRRLAKWLRENRERYDAVIVSRLRGDAGAAMSALAGGGPPIMLRCEEIGPGGDCHWQTQSLWRRRIARSCRGAEAIVATSAPARDELVAGGYDAARLHVIPPGIAGRCDADRLAKTPARVALAESHPLLAVDELSPLAVYAGPVGPGRGLRRLVRAWSEIAALHPGGRLWLIGDYQEAGDVWQEIKDLGLNEQVLLPGVFDDMGLVLDGADVFIAPGDSSAVSDALLEALASGVSVVAPDCPPHRSLLGKNPAALLVPPGDTAALAAALLGCFSKPSRRPGDDAAQFIRSEHCLADAARRHLELVERMLSRSR